MPPQTEWLPPLSRPLRQRMTINQPRWLNDDSTLRLQQGQTIGSDMRGHHAPAESFSTSKLMEDCQKVLAKHEQLECLHELLARMHFRGHLSPILVSL